MIEKKDVKKAEKLEIKEEKRLLKEYAYLNKLKEDIRQKDISAANKLAIKIKSYESKLERAHKRVLDTLEALKAEGVIGDAAHRLDEIEADINTYRADLMKRISGYSNGFKEYIIQENWDELINNVVENLKQDIKDWLTLDKRLIEFEEKLITSGEEKEVQPKMKVEKVLSEKITEKG